ncbi:MAG: hypothetical protein JRF41_08795 [Deltaproteobacteria bacterium]|nr:hypothetical protein [Deltaproteobacteria bacterium]MBW2053053.1 hypothetical protein [Deltaproteobacteria bacterium]MBW2323600.1 hypothetical protein [Deltaproteobacteria bacterium]
MRCPKCGLTSFDYNEACPKCGRDLTPVRENLNLTTLTPSPVFFLGSLLAEEGTGGFTFEGEDTEHLGTYDEKVSEMPEETEMPTELEEVATLEFEAEEDEEAPVGVGAAAEEGIDFDFPEDEPEMRLETEESSPGLDAEETLVFETDAEDNAVELNMDTEEEATGEIDLDIETMADDELSPDEGEELDLSDLALETENMMDELQVEEEMAGEETPAAPEAEQTSAGAAVEEELDLTDLELEFEDEENFEEGDIGDLELSDMELDENTITHALAPDESLEDVITAEAAEEERLGLNDATVIIEGTDEDSEPKTADLLVDDDLEEIDLNFDDLELEDEDTT